MWWELKKLAGWTSREQIPETVLNEEGQEVEGDEALEAWRNAFQTLGKENMLDESFDVEFGMKMHEAAETESRAMAEEHELDQPISENEVLFALLEMQPGKAEGVDEVITEVLMRGGQGMVHALKEICQKAWEREQIPDHWTKGIICPI